MSKSLPLKILLQEGEGTGIKRIRDEVREQGCPEPEFETNGFFTAIFRPNPDVRAQIGAIDAQLPPIRDQVTGEVADQVAGQVTGQVAGQATPEATPEVAGEVEAHAEVRSGPGRGPVGAQSEQVLNALRQTPLAMKELVTVLGLRSKTGALKRKVNELLSGNWIEYTIPAKPKSRLQKYRITPLGREILEKYK